MTQYHRDTALSVTTIILSLLTLFVWIPLDVESGVIETHRRTQYIGDAMLPMVCAVLSLLFGVLLLTQCLVRRKRSIHGFDRKAPAVPEAQTEFLGYRYYLGLFLILCVSLLLIFYAGAVAVNIAHALNIETASYRELRDTQPWKYIGFVLGGTCLVSGLIALIEQQFRWRQILIGIITCVVLIMLFDLPFDDLLLPPNGDY